jgi:ABC-type dipeptide/oligopeptide/nickel transport system permease subunit
MTETYVYDRYASPSKAHWLGTDTNGMDMLTRLMYGGRVSLIIGFIVVVIEASLGILMGGISGYFGGWVDNIIMRVVDIMLALPSLLLALVLVAIFGPSIGNAALALTFVALPHYVRLTRAAVLVEVNRDYVTASRVAGLHDEGERRPHVRIPQDLLDGHSVERNQYQLQPRAESRLLTLIIRLR